MLLAGLGKELSCVRLGLPGTVRGPLASKSCLHRSSLRSGPRLKRTEIDLGIRISGLFRLGAGGRTLAYYHGV